MPDQHPWLAYVLPATAIFNLALGILVAWVRMSLKGSLAQFQIDLMKEINGKYLHSDVAEEKLGRLEDKLDLLTDRLTPAVATRRRKASR